LSKFLITFKSTFKRPASALAILQVL